MKKEKIIKEIKNMIQIIDDNEELFHDGIDEEISYLLIKTLDYLEKDNKKLQDRVDYLIDRNDEKEDIIDKAVEYINVINKNTPSSARKEYAKMILINYEVLLNILKGDNK